MSRELTQSQEHVARRVIDGVQMMLQVGASLQQVRDTVEMALELFVDDLFDDE